MGFSRQEYWSGLHGPPPGGPLNPGIGPMSLMSLALTGSFFTTNAIWKAMVFYQVEITKELIALKERKFAYPTVIRLQCRRPAFHPWVWEIPWHRKWQPIPVFLPEESHEQGSLLGYSPWGRKESNMIEHKSPSSDVLVGFPETYIGHFLRMVTE